MKSRDEIEDYLDRHHIFLTHGRMDALFELYQMGWPDGLEDRSECPDKEEDYTEVDEE